jgi:predicted alpha/beta-hydrolase family hydrolase
MTLFLFAHGAGAPSASSFMRSYARRLEALGTVVTFDYPYMKARSKRPDPHAALVAAHREALAAARKAQAEPGDRVVLIGKSMGGRIGCHVALEERVAALVCLGYPLAAMGNPAKLRDQVLIELRTPILFVQGTRDKLCPLELLETTRQRMTAPNELHVVEGGDHSLLVTKKALAVVNESQDDVERRVIAAIAGFLAAVQ